MNDPARPSQTSDDVVAGIRRRQRLWRHWLREGTPSLGGQLARVGVLGWIVVMPMLLGIWAGRWLDQHYGAGVFWTGALLLAGLVAGCHAGWKWMHSA